MTFHFNAPLNPDEHSLFLQEVVPRAAPQPGSQPISPLEACFVVVSLLLFSGALVPLFQNVNEFQADSGTSGDPLQQLIWFGLYFVTLGVMAYHRQQVSRLGFPDKILLLFLGLTLLSVVWSYAPDVTLRRCIALLGTSAFGIYLAARFDLKQLLTLLGWVAGIAIVLSLGLAVAMPSFGIEQGMHHAGAWRGAYVQKNVLGRMMVLAVLVFSLLFLIGRRDTRPWRWLAAGLVLAALGLLLKTTSATALVILAMLGLVFPFARLFKAPAPLLLSLAIVGSLSFAALGWYFFSHIEAIFELLGRDPTMTGRTGLWEAVILQIQEHLWLGYGYGGFWLGNDGDSAFIYNSPVFAATFSHNGMLDLWLDLGLVGVVAFLFHYLLTALKGLILFRRSPTLEHLWIPLFLGFMLLYNITESAILKQNSIFWILYVATSLKIAQALRPEPQICPAQPDEPEWHPLGA